MRDSGSKVSERTPYLFPVHHDPNYRLVWSNPQFRELAGKVGSGVVGSAWDCLKGDPAHHTATGKGP